MGNNLCNNDSRPGMSQFEKTEDEASSKAKMEAYKTRQEDGLRQELSQKVRQTIERQKFLHFKIEDQKDPKPVIYGGDFYLGDLEGSKPNHFGRMYKQNGSVYIGHFSHGKAQGKGAYVFPDGSYYQGQFRNNVAETANGKYHSDYNTYEGGFKDNKFTGKGTQKGQNFIFEGFFENGSRKQGTLEWEDESGKYMYEGHFNENNEFHGKGVLQEPQGRYEGTFVNGEKDGENCIYVSENGSRYEGSYVNGYREGYGRVFRDDNLIYKGQMKNGLPHGTGSSYRNGSITRSTYFEGIDYHELP